MVSTTPFFESRSGLLRAAAFTLLGVFGGVAQAADADRFAKVVVSSEQVSGDVHMLTGAGGNIAASIGADGTLIVDDQFAPLAKRIQAQLSKLDGDEPRIVINTHFHGDHTGSNAFFGQSATIIAHENVRQRLVAEDGIARAALPVVTFDDRVRVHFNDEAIDIIHMPNGHTDGDVVVWFRGSDVIHMGDHLFVGGYPYIDVQSGGSVNGAMKNLANVLEMVNTETRVIPGHGPLSGIAAIRNAQVLVRDSALLIMRETEAGRTDEEIIALLNDAFPNAGKGFIKPDRWLSIVRSSREKHGS